MKRIVFGVAAMCLTIGSAAAGGHNNRDGFNGADGCIALDQAQSAGGQPEDGRLLSLGKPAGFDRKFEISYDFYSIPDRMTVTYNGTDDKPKTFNTGEISGTGVIPFTVPAGSRPFVQIVVNAGGGNSGTAWIYTPREVTEETATEVTLGSITYSDTEWRNTLGGNISGTVTDIVLEPPTKEAKGKDRCYKKLYYFEVPAGTTCLRVSGVGNSPGDSNEQNGIAPPGIILSKDCPASGCTFGKTTPGIANSSARSTVVLDGDNDGPLDGTWYVTVFKRPNAKRPKSGGILRIDCLQGGVWRTAEYPRILNYDRDRAAVGIEGGSLPITGRILLLSHGRTDSPLGLMKGLGEIVGTRWGRVPYHVNWSEGSFWNGDGLDSLTGTRFVTPAAKALAPLIASNTIDYFGHSWGTYIGNELAIRSGKFNRFFALDPANNEAGTGLLLYYDTDRIDFSRRAGYSLAIFGNGRFGSTILAATADDNILLQPSNNDKKGCKTSPNPVNLARHNEPILLMGQYVMDQQIGAAEVAFALGPIAEDLSKRPWKNSIRKYKSSACDTSVIFADHFNVLAKTNGSGMVSEFRYYIKVPGLLGIPVKKEIVIDF